MPQTGIYSIITYSLMVAFGCVFTCPYFSSTCLPCSCLRLSSHASVVEDLGRGSCRGVLARLQDHISTFMFQLMSLLKCIQGECFREVLAGLAQQMGLLEALESWRLCGTSLFFVNKNILYKCRRHSDGSFLVHFLILDVHNGLVPCAYQAVSWALGTR